MLLLSANQPLRYCAMGVNAVIVFIEPTRGLSFRSSWHHRKVCKRCDHEEKQVVEAVLAFGFPWASYYGTAGGKVAAASGDQDT